MAEDIQDPNTQTKVQESVITVAEESLLSMDELDAAIHTSDPSFQANLDKIGPNDEMIAGMKADLSIDFSTVEGVVTPLTFREKIVGSPKFFLSFLKRKIVGFKNGISESLRTFKYLKLQKKLAIVGAIVLVGAGGFITFRALTKGLFPHEEDLFIGSLKEWAQESYAYEARETEMLYDSTHSSKNIMIIPKMLVNLKRVAGGGENPMAALEFFVEGSSAEVMVEVKDREAEVKDLLQRNIEEMTFDQVASGEGKQLLCEKLRKAINQILTKGKVRRFFMKTAIVKP